MVEETGRLGTDIFKSVEKMMVAFGQLEGVGSYLQKASIPDPKVEDLRLELIREEVSELYGAVAEGDMVEIADALGDITVVVFGMALAYKIDLPSVLGEIQRSNMSKVDEKTGKVIRREDGKVLKPETYSPPNVEAYL